MFGGHDAHSLVTSHHQSQCQPPSCSNNLSNASSTLKTAYNVQRAIYTRYLISNMCRVAAQHLCVDAHPPPHIPRCSSCMPSNRKVHLCSPSQAHYCTWPQLNPRMWNKLDCVISVLHWWHCSDMTAQLMQIRYQHVWIHVHVCGAMLLCSTSSSRFA